MRRPPLARAAAVLAPALLLLTAGCGTAPADTPPPPDADAAAPRPSTPAPERPDCPASGVRITEDGGDAAMGLRVLGLRLTNCGTEPYELHGYPAVAVLDEDGDPYPIKVLRGTGPITSDLEALDSEPEPLTVAPGEYATAALVWRNTVDDLSRPLANGERISVSPAEGLPAQRVPAVVDLGTTGTLGVGPWRAAGAAEEAEEADTP